MDYAPIHIAILKHLLAAGEDTAARIVCTTRSTNATTQAQALADLVATGDIEGPDLFAKYRLTPKAALQMAGATRRGLALMQAAADRLQTAFQPLAKRLQIAGSIRRQKPDCGDIELVALVDSDALACALRERASLILKTGPKYTQAIVSDPDAGPVIVDLFQTADPAQWGMLLFIRTGCSDFVVRALAHWRNKVSPLGYCHENTLRTVSGQIVPTPEEADVFKALQCRYVAPKDRTERKEEACPKPSV